LATHSLVALEETLSITERGDVSRTELFSKVLSSEDFLGEDPENCHHSSTSIVKFGVLLTKLFGRLLLPVVDLSEPDTVVAIKLGTRPPGKFDKSTEKDDLEETGRRDLEGPSNTGVDIRELQVLGRGKVSIKCPLVVVDESSEHGHHRDTAVLALNRTVADELIIVGDVPERVEESKRGGSSNFRGLKESRGGSL